MTIAYLGLGANLGATEQTLRNAIFYLAQQPNIALLAQSSLYRSQPIDADGDDYYNCVIKVGTPLAPRQLLTLCQSTENHFGRKRPYRNAPRTLDLDLLLYGDVSINKPDLIIPHPRLTMRAFVLMPLIELDATINIPQRGYARAFLATVATQRIEKLPAYS